MNIKSIFKGGLFGSNLSDNKLSKKEGGFTIVEVMIVIGIGALIIVLVLVAAPALQRNARNTQRRNDVNSIKAQLLTVTSNANNIYPDNGKFDTDVLGQIEQGIYKIDTSTLAYPTAIAEETVVYIDTSPAVLPATTNTYPHYDELHIIVGASCAGVELNGGYPQATAADKMYIPADLVLTSRRHVSYVYQLEGQTKASCEDNA